MIRRCDAVPSIGSAFRLLVIALVVALESTGVSAQTVIPDTATQRPQTPTRFEVVDASAVVSATTLLARSGTADDPAGLEGLTFTVVDAHARALRDLPGVLEVEVEATRSHVRFTVTSTPATATATGRALHSVETMLRGLPAALAAAQTRFTFTADTPAAEVELEAARLFAGFSSTWARPPRGSVESVGAITPDAASQRFLELMEDGLWQEVQVGPAASLATPVGTSASPPTRPLPAAPRLAWSTEDRIRIVREVTNVWIVAAFPIPADLERTSLDHLVHRIGEILDPIPGDAGLIAAGVDVASLPAGDLLVVRATVLPAAFNRWEMRIRSLPSDITPPFDPEFFRWERRRFRAHLLLADAAPASRSRRIASDLLTTGGVRALAEEAWALEPDDLAEAAARLGPPRVLVFGPDVGSPESAR